MALNNKGAIALSVNALVVIILSLVILGAGVTMLFKFIDTSTQVKADLDSRTEQEIERLLIDKGKRVALPFHIATISGGEKHNFGIGVLNINPKEEFHMELSLSKFLDQNNVEQTSDQLKQDTDDWLLFNPAPFELGENEQSKQAILVAPAKTAPKGTYIFNAKILKTNNEQYGNTQKFTVIVK